MVKGLKAHPHRATMSRQCQRKHNVDGRYL